MVVNIKNHIRKGEIVDVTDWTMKTLSRMFTYCTSYHVKTRGNRFGANGNFRVEGESILVYKKESHNDKR